MEIMMITEGAVRTILLGASYLFIVYLFIFMNKVLSDWWARGRGHDADHAIEEESNMAVALRRGGLYLGLALGMFGVISGPSKGLLQDWIDIASYGAIVSAFFLVARVFNDFVILGVVNNTEEVFKGNTAVGLVEAGGYIATGVIAMSSMMGSGGDYSTAIAFFLIGQVLFLVVTLFYEWVTPWSVKDEIRSGNPSAGLKLGVMMIAVAVAVHGAIAVDFISWQNNLTILAVEGSLAVAFMILLSTVIDRFFLPGTDIKTEIVRDKNVAAIAVVGCVQLAGAFLISAAVV